MNSFHFFGLALVCVGWIKSDTGSALLIVRLLAASQLFCLNLDHNRPTGYLQIGNHDG
jgi:hypothetical protein